MCQARSLKTTIVILATTAAAGFAQDAGLMQADTAFVEAVASADQVALENLLDADFTCTSASGKVQTKAEVLRDMPKMAISNATEAESKVYVYGDLADVQVNSGRSHILRVWARRSDGWKAIVYKEVMSRETPPSFTPGAGKECENPCKTIAFTPKTDTERQVALAYSKLETAAHARNSAAFAPVVADEFVAASSNSDRLQSKRSRIAEFDRSKDAGVAPTPLLSARMFTFGVAVLMVSEHQPDRGSPLHVTRIWVKRRGAWVETLSYQTAVTVNAAQ
jgi:Domain of unknown function (DUF4440)